MSQFRPGREVVVVGVGLHPFGRFPKQDLASLARSTVVEALKDAGVAWTDIPVAYFGHVYYHGMSVGETALAALGLTGIPNHKRGERLLQRPPPPFGRLTGASPVACLIWRWPLARRRSPADRLR